MNNSIRMIGVSLVFWVGFSIGSTNAATSIAISEGNETIVALGDSVSLTMAGIDDATAASGSDHAVFNMNYTAMDFLDSVYMINAAEVTESTASFSNTADPISATPPSFQSPGSMSKAAGHMVGVENSAQISAHQTYAMLLVGLGMLFFSARHRTNTF